VQSLQGAGGLQTADDFSALKGSWVEPVVSDYRGYQVAERPPNGQGFMVSIMLNNLSRFPAAELEPQSAQSLHLQIEAGRLARADRDRFFDEYYGTDRADAALQKFLSADYANAQARRISLAEAMPAEGGKNNPQGGDTTYIAAIDRDGNAVSLMNSVRGPAPRVIAPGKRPVHTIIPGMLIKDGQPAMVCGVVGAEHQPGGQVRLISAVIDGGLDVQEALHLPRVFYDRGTVMVERGVSDRVRQKLHAFGHRTEFAEAPLGAGQAIWIDHRRGQLVGGSDYRKDGCALGL
jgi:gamma-glutamyltranspeptidase/glutathione hydrolase